MEQYCWKNAMLKEVTGGELLENGRVSGKAGAKSIQLRFLPGRVFLSSRQEGEEYLLMPAAGEEEQTGDTRCWILPEDPDGGKPAVEVCADGMILAQRLADSVLVTVPAQECALRLHEPRPRADFSGNRYELRLEGQEELEGTLARFYWDTMLPSVIERTGGKDYPVWRGYVLSTLQEGEYAGTYPDVDHEFQCKGRLAVSGAFDLGIVRRMLELQFRLMREEPLGLWRNPCAIMPDGYRYYHIRRNSMDRRENAEMFLVSGNVEVLETAWLYFAYTKDRDWLRENMENLEGAASLLESLVDHKGRLWSDVFYEDQVIKDGTECMSAALAAYSFGKLAELERVLERTEQAAGYSALSRKLSDALVREVPTGFWDRENRRFVDWIDRNGTIHDHIHLLANILPVLLGYASESQARAVEKLVNAYLPEFQRFPSFVSAKIQDYSDSEIGTGGPYDLCAAGRYWCWDAAYWAERGDREMLLSQLRKVSAQAKLDQYRMGERYDMNHVYYIDEKNWHGAPHYYEYPCVFAWVLLHEYIGIRPCLDGDLLLRPRISGFGTVKLDAWGLEYRYEESGFSVTNTGKQGLSLRLELSALYHGEPAEKTAFSVKLEPGQTRRFPLEG